MARRSQWQSVLHEGGITIAGLHAILRKSGQVVGRNALLRANHAQLEAAHHVERLALKDGRPFDWEIAEPNLLLQQLVSGSPSLQEVYSAAARRHPCTAEAPWHVVIGLDEFTPGSKFKPKNRRKVMVVSFNFLELGMALMSHELSWVTPACVRTVVIVEIDGGWSHMFARLLRLMFTGALSMSRVGIPLVLNGHPLLLFAKMHAMVTDLDALRISIEWRGAGSIRPCSFCANVWKLGSRCIEGHVDITCHDMSLFKLFDADTLEGTYDVILAAFDDVQDGTMTATAFGELQQSLGFNHNANGLLADRELRQEFRVSDIIRTDWVHDLCQDGVLTIEINAFTKAAKKVGVSLDYWRLLLRSNWCFPKHRAVKAAQLHELFNRYHAERSEETGKFKCQASEAVTLYALMRHVCEVQLADCVDLDAEKASFNACCHIMDLILEAKRAPHGSHLRGIEVALAAAIRDFLILHKRAYGVRYFKPKTHMIHHIVAQLLRDNCVLDMFVVERLNLRMRAVAEHVDYTGRYEWSILSSLLAKQTNDLADAPQLKCGLRGSKERLPGFLGVHVAAGLDVEGKQFHKGDCVFVYSRDMAGLVVACAAEGGAFYVIMQRLEVIGTQWPSSGQYWPTTSVQVVSARDVWEVSAWYRDGDRLVVLR